MMDWIVITLKRNKCKRQEFGLIFNILMKNMKCCFTYIMHTKNAKNKKIKIFKFSLALYQILFRIYSGLCKKNLVHVGSKCTILEISSQLWPCRRAGKELLFSDSAASVDSKITDHRILPRPCSRDGPFATGLLQRSTWRGPEEPTRSTLRCHEGCCTTHPGPPSAKSRDQRNPCEAALAWWAVASAIQAAASRSGVYTVLLPRIWRVTSLQSAQLRDAHSFDRLPPGCFSSHAPGPCQLAPGLSRFPLLPRGTVSRLVFGIPASVFLVLGRNWKPTYLILPLDCQLSHYPFNNNWLIIYFIISLYFVNC